MKRRNFIKSGLAASVAVWAGATSNVFGTPAAAPLSLGTNTFKHKYAPHFGMFENHAGKDLIDQLKFMADQGFTALEDNGMMSRPVAEQERLAKEMARLQMTMGVFVTYAEFGKATFVNNDKEVRDMLLKQMRAAVEVAKRVNAKWTTVVPGMFSTRLEWDYQTANVVEHLKACAEIFAPHGVIMVLEPLNAWRDHPGLFLTKIPQAYQVCRAINSPSCKILDDLYHQQITEGNLIPNIDLAWEEIAYFQIGDNPGRKEPTTGEVNFRNVFKHIYEKGYRGVMGMEHGNSKPGKDGELAVIEAYKASDNF